MPTFFHVLQALRDVPLTPLSIIKRFTSLMKKAFTLLELLAVIAIILVLAALLLPGLSAAKARARRASCLNNLKHVNLGIHMYADEHDNVLSLVTTNTTPNVWTDYKSWMKSYLGLKGASSAQDSVFACPDDAFSYSGANGDSLLDQGCHLQSRYNFSSYAFNAGNLRKDAPFTNAFPGIAGRKLTTIRNPSKTILVAEFSALLPYSWHERKRLPANAAGVSDAKNLLSFVDGHASFLKIYWDEQTTPDHFEAWHYDPPAGYDYQWSGD